VKHRNDNGIAQNCGTDSEVNPEVNCHENDAFGEITVKIIPIISISLIISMGRGRTLTLVTGVRFPVGSPKKQQGLHITAGPLLFGSC